MVLEGGGDPLGLDAAAVDAGVHALVAAGRHAGALALGDRGGEGALPLGPRPQPLCFLYPNLIKSAPNQSLLGDPLAPRPGRGYKPPF